MPRPLRTPPPRQRARVMDRATSPAAGPAEIPAADAPVTEMGVTDARATDAAVTPTSTAEPIPETSADTQTSPPQGEVCNLHWPDSEEAGDIPVEPDTGEREKTPRQAELILTQQPVPSPSRATAAPPLYAGNPPREEPETVETRTAQDDQYPPTDWRSGYEILLHLGLIRYLTETPDLTQAGAQAAQAQGLSLTAEDWQGVARTTPEVATSADDEQVSTPTRTPEIASSAQTIRTSEPALQEDLAEPVRNPAQPDAAQSPDKPEDTTSASGLQQTDGASDLPDTHWAQAERPVETPTRSSGLRSLTVDRQPGGFPRRSYAGMPRPRVTASVDEDIQALRRTRAQMRSDGICQAIAQFLSRRHHRTARLRQISSALCGTLINGEEVFDSDITDGINTLVDNGRIVLLSNGDIFLLNPPDM